MESVEPSSTTTISWGTLRSVSSSCRCSMVEAMQPSSSRAGMTTESSESGRAGLVSRVLGILAFPNGEAAGAGQVGLIFVKGEEFVRSGLASDGDVEEIHGTDGQVAGMDGAEFVGGAHGVGPTEIDMVPIAEADFLFEGADNRT